MRSISPESCSYAWTGYANPHAVTSVGGTTYTYDNNGNVTAIGSLDYTWDWRNRLASAERSGGGITSYGYDHTGQRVFQATGSATTSYPNRYYNIASSSLAATTTKHIFAPDGTLLATVVGASTTATTTYLHPDHLGGTNVTTNTSGAVTQTLDYYPYGSQRINSGSSAEQRRFIGEEYDSDTEFSYLNARYYQGSRGQFMSQDPVFLLIGDPTRVKEMTRKKLVEILADPQALNSYSYARNNPLVYVDSTGKWYVQLGATFALGPVSAGYGIRFNNQGIVTYYSAGAGFGLMADIGVEFNSGDIDVERSEFTISHDAAFAGGPSINTSYENKFDPKNPLQVGQNGTRSFGIGAGIGGRINQTYTQSIPVYRFGSDVYSCTNCHSSGNNAGTPTDASSRSYVGPSGASVDAWAIVRAAISQYHAEGGK
jgi:RHS repeat-associated protein